jgi:hypothetical protein
VSQKTAVRSPFAVPRRSVRPRQNTIGSGAQAPLHSDVDVNLAHEYALTRVTFREPQNSRLVVRMNIDRHNCAGSHKAQKPNPPNNRTLVAR